MFNSLIFVLYAIQNVTCQFDNKNNLCLIKYFIFLLLINYI